ncbi:hypothetical protein BDR22DRAFT_89900 [Usnea florida]
MLFLATLAGLLSLGAAAPLISSFPCGSESTTQVVHASFLEWIVQIPEQVLAQFKWYNKRYESGIESGDPHTYSAPGLPKRSKMRIDSGDSVEELDSPITNIPPLPKRSKTSIEPGDSVDEPEPQFTSPGSIPKRSEASTESGAFIDEPASPPGALPKRSDASTESGASVDEPGYLPKRSDASTESGASVDEPGYLPKRSDASTESGESGEETASPLATYPEGKHLSSASFTFNPFAV